MISNKYSKLNTFCKEFLNAKPFPYLVLDNFFEKKFFYKITNELNNKKLITKADKFDTIVEKNKSINRNVHLPYSIKKILHRLSEPDWVQNLKKLSGIIDLEPDKTDDQTISNFHEMSNGGFLGSHVDHSNHPKNASKHVLNIILYLSNDWESAYGGNTLLFNKYGKKVKEVIEYKPNRMIIFLHTPYSFHGVDELNPRKNKVRKTLYLDYYSNLRNPYFHINLPFKNHFFRHGTTFILQNRSEYFKPSNFYYTKTLLKYKINKYI